jgi:hypothetical protein
MNYVTSYKEKGPIRETVLYHLMSDLQDKKVR